jgi:dTDP-4-amino-4,6-dideoxygalactose transaminase
MKIPMVDLKMQLSSIRNEIDGRLASVLDATQFIRGPAGKMLEEEIAEYFGVKYAVGVASGTDALHLALLAAGIGPGDEVITTPFTFIATAEAICYVGARPVFVDIEPDTFNIDPDLIEEAVTERTRAVLPVHLFGQAAAMDSITRICQKYNLKLVEDCAQSFGAECKGKKTGTFGDAGCFSFFPSKNLGCFGDAGMIITDDEKIADEVEVLRNHGSRERYYHSVIGFNSRLDEMQAVVLLAKMKHIDSYNDQRWKHAQIYSSELKGLDIITPFEAEEGTHVYHQYTIRTEKRDTIHKALKEAGIASAIYYPVPLHQQVVFREICSGQSFPVAEESALSVLSLPIYPELTNSQIKTVCRTISEAV